MQLKLFNKKKKTGDENGGGWTSSNPYDHTNPLFEAENVASDDDNSLDGDLLLDDGEDVEEWSTFSFLCLFIIVVVWVWLFKLKVPLKHGVRFDELI